jgi:hypothetical protein
MRANSRIAVPKPSTSPYSGVDLTDARALAVRTGELLARYPASASEVIDVVLSSWDALFNSQIGPARIGRDIFPSPQVLGSFMHELVPLKMRELLGADWRGDQVASEKDIVNVKDGRYSTEIKTSSSTRQIYANRSFGQPDSEASKKEKSGYYLAINFEGWQRQVDGTVVTSHKPSVTLLRMGWLDHTDWYAQLASTGQAASLPPKLENCQLLTIYSKW